MLQRATRGGAGRGERRAGPRALGGGTDGKCNTVAGPHVSCCLASLLYVCRECDGVEVTSRNTDRARYAKGQTSSTSARGSEAYAALNYLPALGLFPSPSLLIPLYPPRLRLRADFEVEKDDADRADGMVDERGCSDVCSFIPCRNLVSSPSSFFFVLLRLLLFSLLLLPFLASSSLSAHRDVRGGGEDGERREGVEDTGIIFSSYFPLPPLLLPLLPFLLLLLLFPPAH
jgi:hypothetical protein